LLAALRRRQGPVRATISRAGDSGHALIEAATAVAAPAVNGHGIDVR
jgi:hypothetical protein